MHIANADGNRKPKCNTNCNENSYPDTYGGSVGYTYSYICWLSDTHADVRSRRYSRAVDTGSAGSH